MSAAASAVPWATMAAVAGGAAVGALLRYGAGLWLNPLWQGFPLGTLLVNAVGAFAIGVAMVLFERHPNEVVRMLVVTGLLGGLTTFSAFSAESLGLLQRGLWAVALLHTLAHVLGSLACAATGFGVARLLVPHA